MFPAVWERVVHGRYRSARGTLAGFARYAIEDEVYPGMVAEAGAQVEGVLYFDVDAEDLAALDAFEGADYRREQVAVLAKSGERVDAYAYIYLLPARFSGTSWNPGEFQMARFIASYCAAYEEKIRQ
jgi:gamma-glutamylcyclotransferase (GGCT)/AIG2-like uncharacterized protein YtfP